jgi:hypothetical protein
MPTCISNELLIYNNNAPNRVLKNPTGGIK